MGGNGLGLLVAIDRCHSEIHIPILKATVIICQVYIAMYDIEKLSVKVYVECCNKVVFHGFRFPSNNLLFTFWTFNVGSDAEVIVEGIAVENRNKTIIIPHQIAFSRHRRSNIDSKRITSIRVVGVKAYPELLAFLNEHVF